MTEKEDAGSDRKLREILKAYKKDEIGEDGAIRKIRKLYSGNKEEIKIDGDKIRMDLDIKDVKEFLSFIDYLADNLASTDPLEPAVKLYQDLVDTYSKSAEKKDQRVASALKATYSNGKLDLEPIKGRDAVRIYKNDLGEDDPGDSNYYKDLHRGQSSFTVECNSNLSEDTLKAIKEFIDEKRRLLEEGKSLPEYRKLLSLWLKNRKK